MKYPYQIEIFYDPDEAGKFQIFIRQEMVKVDADGCYIPLERRPADCYDAKNAEELLVFLMGVYDWYPAHTKDHSPGEEE